MSALAASILESEQLNARTSIRGRLAIARPGRFIRSALAGMTALAEGLIDTHPGLVDAIRSGQQSDGSSDLRFLMGITPRVERAVALGSHRGSAVTFSLEPAGNGVLNVRSAASALVHHAPFSLVLAHANIAAEFPHRDCTSWLNVDVETVLTNFLLELPAVRLHEQAHPFGLPEDFEATFV